MKRALENDYGSAKKKQIVVTKSKVPEVGRYQYDRYFGGHMGISKTLQEMRERFYWINCSEYVKE